MSDKTYLRTCVMIALAFSSSTCEDADADFTFGEPVNLGALVNTSYRDGLACTSADGLSLFLSSQRPEGYGGWDLWRAKRLTTDDPWEDPVNLGPTVNSSSWELGPSLSPDGLMLLFQSDRPNGCGSQDFWATTRTSSTAPWESPVNLGTPVNSNGNEVGPSLSVDWTTLFFSSNRSGGYGGDDLYVAMRPTVADAWETVVNLGEAVNTSHTERAPSLSADGRMLFFHSDRPGGRGSYDIWVVTRSVPSDSWSTPANLGPLVNSSVEDVGPTISQDGRTLFFMSMRSGGYGQFDAWQVSVEPIVDFDADAKVDLVDLVMLIDNWDTDDALYDIGPMPWGNGVVNIEDLKVFITHWEEENMPSSEGGESSARSGLASGPAKSTTCVSATER